MSGPKLPQFNRSFVGAVQLAKAIKKQFPTLGAKYQGNICPGFIGAVHDYLPGVRVDTFESKFLRSFSQLLRHRANRNHCIILYPASFNYCYRRFAICKELCQVLTDDESVAAQSVSSEFLLAIEPRDRIIRADKGAFSRKLKSEEFCIFLAIEMMLPHQRRDEIVEMVKLRRASNFDAAKLVCVPESLIKFYLDSEYHTYWQDAYGE